MFGVFPILRWQNANKACPHFLLSTYEWAWETQTYFLNKPLNTNKLYLLLTLKDQRTTWHNPKDRFALDSALQTKQDTHEINTPLSWSKSLVKSAHHPEPRGCCSNSIRTSTEINLHNCSFPLAQSLINPACCVLLGKENQNFWGQPRFWRIFSCFSFTRNTDSSKQEARSKKLLHRLTHSFTYLEVTYVIVRIAKEYLFFHRV